MAAYGDLQQASAERISEGKYVSGAAIGAVAIIWNVISFGNAGRMDEITDDYEAGDISKSEMLTATAKSTGTAAKDLVITVGGGAAGRVLSKLDTVETVVDAGVSAANGDVTGALLSLAGEAIPGGKKVKAKKPKPGGPTAKNLSDSKKPPVGSYTNTHASGTKYHGKGTKKRSDQSAKEKAESYDDPVVDQDFEPASNDREAFKDEARRIRDDGGVKSDTNYNKINSPREKYLKADGE